MKSVKIIARFFLFLVFFYTLFMVPWPGLDGRYARLFEAGAESVLGSFGSNGAVRFWPIPPSGDIHNTALIVGNLKTGGTRNMRITARFDGYLPTAFLAALILSTPLPLRRRLWTFVWGFLLLHAFIGLKLFVTIACLFSQPGPAGLFTLGDFSQDILTGAVRLVAYAPFFLLVVPTFIWVLVTFRRGDLTMILGDRPTSTAWRRRPEVGPARRAHSKEQAAKPVC